MFRELFVSSFIPDLFIDANGTLVETFGLLVPFFCMFAVILTAFALNSMLASPVKQVSARPVKQPTKNDFQPRESPLEMAGVLSSPWRDPESAGWLEHSQFRGLYTLLSVLVSVELCRMFYMNYDQSGSFIQSVHKLYAHFSAGPELLICLSMEYCFCHLGFGLQLMFMRGLVPRSIYSPVQWVLQLTLLGCGSVFTWHRPSWPFTHKIALMFQTVIFSFKFHSYSSTNLELSALRHPDSPTVPHPRKDQDRVPVEDLTLAQLQAKMQALGYAKHEAQSTSLHHLQAMVQHTEQQRLAKAIYPENVTFGNFSCFLWMPTLVYEVSYPRTEAIRPAYLLEKAITAFGVLSLMWHILENFMIPGFQTSSHDPVQAFLSLVSPTMAMILLGFFLVFDCILCGFAELTRFADREFYRDWWNSTTFEEFSRKWNKPVHEFLLRHVYMALYNTYKWPRSLAMATAFGYSIFLHELVLSMVFRSVRPWLAMFSFSQIPLRPLMALGFIKGKRLGNLVFWYGQCLGVPLIMVLYSREFCSRQNAC